MTATPARIGFILRPDRWAVAESSIVRDRYGQTARESPEPVETFFDSVEDADIVAEERLAIWGAARRLFQARAIGLDEVLEVETAGATIPVVSFSDAESDVDTKMIAGDIGFDFARQECEFTLWG